MASPNGRASPIVGLSCPECPRCRLICFPHGGGAAHAFAGWPDGLPDWIEVLAFNPPGRGARLREPLVDDLGQLVDDIRHALTPFLDLPVILFGHSVGALVAFEVARRLEADGVTPLHVIVSAHAAPEAAPPLRTMSEAPDDELMAEIAALGLLPPDAFASDELRSLVLAPTRADFRLSERYVAVAGTQIAAPLTAFGGRGDPLVTEAALAAWGGRTKAAFSARMFDGGHFYTVTAREQVLSAVSELAAASLRMLPPSIHVGASEDYPLNTCLHELFRASARATPGALALAGIDRSLDFATLDSESDLLARMLLKRGCRVDATVAILMETSVDFVVACLAILKAGGAYLPIAPALPDLVIRDILESVRPVAVVTRPALLPRLAAEWRTELKSIPLAERWASALDASALPAFEAVAERPGPHSLAYCVMTSGTTGKPKGIVCPHQGAVNSYWWRYVHLPYGEGEREACNVFFVWEVLRPLLQGRPAYVIPDDIIFDPRRLVGLLEREAITRVLLTPSLFEQVLNTCGEGLAQRLGALRMVILNGEVVSLALAERARAALPHVALVNDYSISECHDVATSRIGDARAAPGCRTLPAGSVMANVRVYVLGDDLEPTPWGVQGEIYVAGPTLARGYLDLPAETAERFVPDPFQGGAARMFRTGDVGRILPDGQLEIRGRARFMVKLRGYSIVPSAVEAVISRFPAVGAAAVVTLDDPASGQPASLAAYVTGRNGGLTPGELTGLRAHLKAHLAPYAIPTHLVVLPALPIQATTGKVDRKRLPPPQADGAGAPAAEDQLPPGAVAAGVDIASAMTEIWRALLGRTAIAWRDNFFDLGGHSLLAIRLACEAETRFGARIDVVDVFDHPTLEAFCRLVAERATQPATAAPVVARKATNGREAGPADIAVIGMACRFPGADSPEALWRRLEAGEECVRRFTPDELSRRGVAPASIADADYVRAGAVLDDVALFDARFFGLSEREATLMDPQHRLFIECCHEALERAGHTGGEAGVLAGVWGGCYLPGYLVHHLGAARHLDPADPTAFHLAETGNDKDYLATRAAFLLNLKGPAISVQTSCSTGLVAIVEAAEALRTGRCDLALAGASSITFPQAGYKYVKGHIGSRSGHCRTFDAEADGTVLGDGVGIVALRRLEDALADGDDVLAVIKGYAINNDGAEKAGYSAPSGQAQARAVRAALDMGGLDAASIGYVEAHGTATLIGDPIEVRALTAAFGQGGDRAGTCVLGSVKPNLGHSNIAAGVAGFIKTVLVLRHGRFVAQANFTRANPELRLAETPFRIETSARPWNVERGKPRRAGVSSFGIGGTNAHVVLEEAPGLEVPAADASGEYDAASEILPLSAKSPSALIRACRRLADHLEAQPKSSLAAVAATLQLGRTAYAHRCAAVASTPQQAIAQLRAIQAAAEETSGHGGPVLVFPGQGAQFPAMGAELMRGFPTFAEHFGLCRELFRAASGVDVALLHHADQAARLLSTARGLQAALFATEYALGKLLIGLGLRPKALAGHSLGQIVAASLAGMLSLDDAVGLVAVRATAMEAAPPGAMTAVAASKDDVSRLIAGHPSLTIAAENGIQSVVVGGAEPDVAAFEIRSARVGIASHRLQVSRAFHTPMMREAAARVAEAAARIRMNHPAIPVACNVTGGWMGADAISDPGGYWSRHVLAPVQFARNAAAVVALSPSAIIESGPGRSLARLITAAARGAGQSGLAVLPAMRHGGDAAGSDRASLDRCLARVWELGSEVDWRAYRTGRPTQRVVLPRYPFERKRYWPKDDMAQGLADRSGTRATKLAWQDRFYVPSLRRASRPENVAGRRQSWLLLVSTDDALGGALEAALRAAGHEVEPLRLEPDGRMPSGLAKAIARLGAGSDDGRIMLCAPAGDRDARHLLEPVIALARLLIAREQRRPLQLFVLTDDALCAPGETLERPHASTILGPLLVLQQEDPTLTARLVDIGFSARIAPPLVEDVAAIVDEITAARPRSEPQVALRAGVPWVERYDQITLGEAQRAAGRKRLASGPHIITGGLGRIGLTLAAHLAGLGVDVILITRQPMPPRGEWAARAAVGSTDPALKARLSALLAAGKETGRVHVVCADATDSAAMGAVLSECEREFGTIGGIFHAAGLAGLEDLADVTPASLGAELAPKVAGTHALFSAIHNHRRNPKTRSAPKFVMLFSSLAASLGGLGLASYAAANRFLDAFVAVAPERGGVCWLSVAWDDWDFDYGVAQQAAFARTRSGLSIAPGEGLAAIEAILGEPELDRVLISATPLEPRLDAWVRRTRVGGQTPGLDPVACVSGQVRASLTPSTSVQACSHLEARVAAAYAAVLGSENAGLDDNFFDLGGDSLLATEIVLALGRDGQAPVRLKITDVFDHSTIRELAIHIRACCEEAGARPVD